MDYIHLKPVKAEIVRNAIDWEKSLVLDYAEMQNQDLINKEMTEIIGINPQLPTD